MSEVGERVGAIISMQDGVVAFAGYGVYSGEEVPPADVSPMLNEFGVNNPKITLDDGKVVWGCECWWGPEKKMQETIARATKVVVIDIEVLRAQQNAQHSVVKEEEKPNA